MDKDVTAKYDSLNLIPQDPHNTSEELTPTNCPLTSTWAKRLMHPYTNTNKISTLNKYKIFLKGFNLLSHEKNADYNYL